MNGAQVDTALAKRATETDREVGSRVRLRRKELQLSQQKLGSAIGVSFQQVQKYESGANRIGASRLKELSRILGVPLTYFFDDALGLDSPGALQRPGAVDLLGFYNQIETPALARAVVDLARTLARAECHKAAGRLA